MQICPNLGNASMSWPSSSTRPAVSGFLVPPRSHGCVGGAGRAEPRHGSAGRGCEGPVLIRDRDAKCPAPFDQVLADAGIEVVLTGIRMPRMNAIMERWVQTCRRELLDRTLIWNHAHLLHALRQFEIHYNGHRPHRALGQAAPLRPIPEPITEQAKIVHLDARRRDRLGGILHQYEHAA